MTEETDNTETPKQGFISRHKFKLIALMVVYVVFRLMTDADLQQTFDVDELSRVE